MTESRVSFPEELPISARVRDIAQAIDAHPVVVIAGETGSGKTTQLPKICLAMGRGLEKHIGVTQPRRIAATSVAARVAQELKVELGREVGYQIRFNNRSGPGTYVKFMTDGILLAELQGDPLLRGYDTIILDEAHERTLNIDFLLGVMKRLVVQRPDLRVVISSATLEIERFKAFFDDAPVIQVSGRTYPVEVVYRPFEGREAEGRDLSEQIASAVEEITNVDPREDILVFLPGEREIREAEQALHAHSLPRTVTLPLYGRLSQQEQSRVFQRGSERRIVLATNVAETSLTIPGIVYVIDAGLARLNRYEPRSGVTRLLVEPISRASADQRKGRAGRTRSGVCFRLYAEDDFNLRPAYTDPEVLRVGLAGAILQMRSTGLGDIRSFPFLDPPPKRAMDEGYRVLEELGALDDAGNLTDIGHKLAKLPVDPRIGRMILAGEQEGALREVLIIAAALGIQDPRERPQAMREKADQAHRRFKSDESDFASWLKLWTYYQEESAKKSQGQLRKLCRDGFLNYLRMREWSDVHHQLARSVKDMGFKANEKPASDEAITRALLPGLLSRIGMWNQEQRTYSGARQTKFMLHPSSGLAKKPPPWVVAAELVETSQLFARTVAKIDPTWLEAAGGPLCRKSHGDPSWAERPAQVMVRENVSLYGLPIVRDRRVHLGPIDPAAARRIFIRHALVRGEYTPPGKAPAYIAHNQALFAEVSRLRDKARRSDMLADEEALALFFEKRVPEGVFSGKTFEEWRKKAEADPALFEWTIPGWHQEKVNLLLHGLPKSLRKAIGGATEAAKVIASSLTPFSGPMLPMLAKALFDLSGAHVPRDSWDLHTLPPHLRFRFKVMDEGRVAGEGRDLSDLKDRLGGRAREAWRALPRQPWEKQGLTGFPEASIPAEVPVDVAGSRLLAFPALVEVDGKVSLVPFSSREDATRAMRGGLRRLFVVATGTGVDKLERDVPAAIGAGALLDVAAEPPRRQIARRALDEAFLLHEPARFPRSRADFNHRYEDGRRRLATLLKELGALATEIGAELGKARAALKALEGKPGGARASLDDVRNQLALLCPPGFLERLPRERLAHFPRYLRAAQLRLDRLPNGPQKDQSKADQVVPIARDFWAKRDALLRRGASPEELEAFRWLLEELRVSVFAPELRAAVPVSPQKLAEQWKALAE